MKTALIALVVVLLLGAAVTVWAQRAPAAGDPAAAGNQGGAQAGGRNFGMMARGMGMMAPPVMTVVDGALFVVLNGTLFKVDPNEMKLLGSVRLITPEEAAARAARAAQRGNRGADGAAGNRVPPPPPAAGAQGPAPAPAE